MKKIEKEDWMNKKWRPAMGWMYMTVCIFDFILFPVMFTTVQFWEIEAANDAFRQWVPITLGGGGLFHVAMGAILGITAWSRGQEKISGVAGANNSQSTLNSQTPTSYPQIPNVPPAPVSENTQVISYGYKGKKTPPEPDYPVI